MLGARAREIIRSLYETRGKAGRIEIIRANICELITSRVPPPVPNPIVNIAIMFREIRVRANQILQYLRVTRSPFAALTKVKQVLMTRASNKQV